MNTLTIRKATVADAAILYEWDKKPHVKAAVSSSGDTGFEADWVDELSQRYDGSVFFIAEIVTPDQAMAIGAMQVIDPSVEQTHYWGAVAPNQRAIDIWIGEEQFIGKGYGTQMMTYAINFCFEPLNVMAILIDPLSNNTRSHNFYKRFGFEFMERRQFDKDSDCYVFKLTRTAWQNISCAR